MNILETQRIKIRALEPEDIEVLYKWENDTDVWKISSNISPLSKYVLKEFIKNQNYDLLDSKQMRLVIERKQDGCPLGTLDLFDIDMYNRRAEIGILIYSKNENGKGYATEAINTMTTYCFDRLDLKQLYCSILSENHRSIELFKRCGFVATGTKKNWRKTIDGWSDEIFMQKINDKATKI